MFVSKLNLTHRGQRKIMALAINLHMRVLAAGFSTLDGKNYDKFLYRLAMYNVNACSDDFVSMRVTTFGSSSLMLV